MKRWIALGLLAGLALGQTGAGGDVEDNSLNEDCDFIFEVEVKENPKCYDGLGTISYGARYADNRAASFTYSVVKAGDTSNAVLKWETELMPNYEPGKYTAMAKVADSLCDAKEVEFEITSSPAFVTKKPVVKKPSGCSESDGSLEWEVTGGTPPLKFTMGNATGAEGRFTDLSYSDFKRIVVEDSKGCKAYMPYDELRNMEICLPTSFEALWATGGVEGVIFLGVCLGIVIIEIVGFQLWKRKIDRQIEAVQMQRGQKKTGAEMKTLKGKGTKGKAKAQGRR